MRFKVEMWFPMQFVFRVCEVVINYGFASCLSSHHAPKKPDDEDDEEKEKAKKQKMLQQRMLRKSKKGAADESGLKVLNPSFRSESSGSTGDAAGAPASPSSAKRVPKEQRLSLKPNSVRNPIINLDGKSDIEMVDVEMGNK